MKLSKSAVLLALGATFVGAGLIVACGGDDDSGSTTTKDAGTATDAGSTTVADTGATVVDSGSTVDAGDGGLKGYGQTCGGNAECESDYCFISSGSGPNSAGTYCTIACTMPTLQDPVCANKAGLTGKCNKQSYCQPTVH